MKNVRVEQLIDQQSNLFRERNQSQFSRMLDLSVTFCTYYSLDGVASTAELGTRDIMEYVGPESPVRYNKVHQLPLYGVEIINGEINFDEILGTSTELEGNALVLNSVIRPLPGDHFVIESFNRNIIFVVNNVNTRAIRGEDHRIITYSVAASSRLAYINRQVEEEFDTIFRNIGTEDKVVLRRSDYQELQEAIETYSNITDYYLDEFYDSDIGYIRTPEDMNETHELGHATCKYIIRFMMENQIIYFDSVLQRIFAFETPIAFQPKHNKIYARQFPIKQFVDGRVNPNAEYWISYQTMPVSLFKNIDDIKLIQSVDFPQITDNRYPDSSYNAILFSKEYANDMISKKYDNMETIPRLVARIYNNDDIPLSHFKTVVDDYETDDIFRMYFIPFILWGLGIKIKAIQNKSLEQPKRSIY